MKKHLNVGFYLPVMIMFFMFPVKFLQAQWNTNTSVNLLISNLPTADLHSVATTDGKTWIAFYHLNGSNYDMRAQLLDANGNKLLGPDGILVSNQTSGSATYVFNVCVDASNNLIIGFQYESGSDMNAVVHKISQSGAQLWGSGGIILGAGLTPYPAPLSNGEVVVAWSESVSNTVNIQKITTGGTLAWTTPVVVTVGATKTSRGQVIGNLNGKFTAVYQKKGSGISTTLYAQHFDNSGTALYSALQICNQTSSASRYYSIAANGDTTYFGFYVSQSSRFNSFLQRINPSGTIPWGMNGSNFNTATSSSDPFQGLTNIALSSSSPYVWSVCTFSNSNQSQYGVYVQKFLKTTGARQFTDNGKVVYPISSSSDYQSGEMILVNDTPIFLSYDVNDIIYATRLDASGNFVWPGNRVEISSTTAGGSTPKMRFGLSTDGPNRCAGVWTENRTGDYMGYAQGISIGGLIGVNVATQGGVPATITTSGGTLQMVATVLPAAASQNVTWSIVPGTGNATINATGLVTATGNGTVYAKATAVQDVTVKDSLLITISGQTIANPVVTTLAATNIAQTAATLNGSVTANLYPTTVSFDWGTSTAYGNTIAATPSVVTGSSPVAVLANLTSLTTNVTYHFRCVGTSSAGTFNGADQTFIPGCQTVGSAGAITGPISVCNNATGNVYSVSPILNATSYTWTVPTGATIVSGQNTASITVTFGTSSGNITVYGSNICSTGTTSTLAVTTNAGPIPTITGSASPCLNSGTTAYTTESGMNGYTWTVSAGGTITSGSGTNQIVVNWTTTGAQSVSVNYTNPSGCSAPSPTNYPVVVNPLPAAAGPITGLTTVCAGTAGVSYSVDLIANTSVYLWSLPLGANIASGANTNNITVDFSATTTSGDITVAGNNICGNGISSNLPVTVNPIPPAPVISLSNVLLTSNAASGNQWYFDGNPISGATGQTYLATQNGWYWDKVTLNDCPSDTSNHIFVVVEGLDELQNENVAISPVPNDGRFSVSITNTSLKTYSIRIYNQIGACVYQADECRGNEPKLVDLRPAATGLYTVVVRNVDNMITRKILISK